MVMPEFGKPNPRADSFSLYSNYVANTLLQNLLPKSKIDMKSHVLGRTSNHRTAPKVVTTVVKQTPVKTVTRKKLEPKPESKPDQITAPPILPQRAVSQGLHTTQDPKTFEKALEKAADKKPIQMEALRTNYFRKDAYDTPVKNMMSPLVASNVKTADLQEMTPQIHKHKASFKMPPVSTTGIQTAHKTQASLNYVGLHVVEPTQQMR